MIGEKTARDGAAKPDSFLPVEIVRVQVEIHQQPFEQVLGLHVLVRSGGREIASLNDGLLASLREFGDVHEVVVIPRRECDTTPGATSRLNRLCQKS